MIADSLQLALDSAPFLLKGAYFTVGLSLGGMFFGLLLGFGLALMRLSSLKVLSWTARVYVSFFRGTPLLVQLFVIYYGLPQLGLELDPLPAALIGLSLNMAAYACEILRAAISSIDRGQRGSTGTTWSPERMIVVEHLTKQFNGQTVLAGINLTVNAGEVIAIIGPSGSGKTTFLRCLNLLETPSSGRIRVGNIEIDGNRPLKQQQGLIRQLRQHVGFVFQNFNLFPHRTALENVIEGPIVVKKTPRDAAITLGRALLQKVGLGDKENAYPRRLSGGQQQRVAIARALAMEPEVILFDKGVIVEQGEAKALFANPREERTRQFLGKFLGMHASQP